MLAEIHEQSAETNGKLLRVVDQIASIFLG
ncbi:hypothetical protein LAX5112_04657 [Roseibium alexandrii]|uniref:Uncharacterized protein n=1 Tax=Roseibium alexandrii TaxID=388408 RepID=A0A0M7ASV6_9HYPH|nr:hypothetical protein LAX5112_04657 [Roseibium alexandrii]